MKQLVVTCDETKREVIEALEKVGFKYNGKGRKDRKFIAIYDDNIIKDHTHLCSTDADYIYSDSYVIAHAEELHGAKKPWEIPPVGYRIATIEERRHPLLRGDFAYFYEEEDEWWNFDSRISAYRPETKHIAVSIDYKFEPETIEVSIDDIAKWKGVSPECIKVKK